MRLLYAACCIFPRLLNSDTGELPRRKLTAFRERQKFEIKKNYNSFKYQFVFVQTGKASGTFYSSVSQPPGPGINHTGPREALLEFVILVF
jgi:hypothetical protein